MSTNSPLFTKQFNKDPHPAYDKFRETEPIKRTVLPDGQVCWVVTKYEDNLEILLDFKSFSKDITKVAESENQNESAFLQNMLFKDPPDHKRLRGLVQKAFTPSLIEEMRESIQLITDEAINEIGDKKSFELIEEFAFPVPIFVLCELLGVPKKDRVKFQVWSNTLVEGSFGDSAEEVQKSNQEFVQYLTDFFVEKRNNLGDDLVSLLIKAEEDEDEDKLTPIELFGVVGLFIIAGHETTVNLIGNGIVSLMNNPEQFEQLKNNPELIHQTIDEMLRFSGPLEYGTQRYVVEDLEFKGVKMNKGDIVLVGLNASNHDPSVFEDPDEFDINREVNPHVAFGKGIHFCIGAPLARLEGEIAINSLIKRFPNMKLNVDKDELVWRPGMLIRGLEEVPLAIK